MFAGPGVAAGARPWGSLWRAEDVVNWEVERIGERSVLVGVVLKDGARLLAFRMDSGACFQEVWTQVDGQWMRGERTAMRRGDAPLGFIPFVFHGPRHSRPEPARLACALSPGVAIGVQGDARHFRETATPDKGFSAICLFPQGEHGKKGPGLRPASKDFTTDSPK
ncbi:MAG TPA: hypothetical protein VFE51_10905 [Verrucomicrobiae bacterium]|nr:hypothetical protein [Verrucomicrobiae bacterium]